MELRPTDYIILSKWFIDFQKHSKCFDMPPEEAECIGIYDANILCGYFIVLPQAEALCIVQGYLDREHRHKNLSPECMKLLEFLAKKAGYKTIALQTQSRFKTYIDFMKPMGYAPKQLVFSKEI